MEQNQNLREKMLRRWAVWSIDNWGKALLIALSITILLGIGFTRLKMEMTFYSILPDRSNQVQDLKNIVQDFPYASGIIVVVDGRSIPDPVKAEAKVKAAIDALSSEFSQDTYKPYIDSVMGKYETSFIKEHGLMLTSIEDLDRFGRSYSNLNLVPVLRHLNDDFEREYSGNSENLSDDEVQAANQFRGLGELLELIEAAAAGEAVSENSVDKVLDSYIMGSPYLMSNDNRMGIVIVQPTFNMNDMDNIMLLREGVDIIEAGAKAVAAVHGISAGLTGMTTIARDEFETSEQGLALSSTIAFVLILALLVFVFRMFSVPFIAGIPLITGIMWTVGLSGLVINRLNIMTAMYIVALLGLGIDYAIHLLSTYIQEKDSGADFKAAVESAVVKSGAGIITGALTTSVAFFTLMVAKTGLIQELGIVAGMGILSELFAMFLMIPPLLAYREYRRVKKGKSENRIFSRIKIKSDAASGIGRLLVKAPVAIAVVMSLIVMAFSFRAGRVDIQDNILEMEAKGLESVKLNDEMVEEFNMAPDGLYIVTSDLEEVKELTGKLKDLSSVKSVDSLADYFITDKEYWERASFIEQYTNHLENSPLDNTIDSNALLEELYRLETNLIELGDLSYLGNMDRLVNVLGKVTGIDKDGVKAEETSFDRLFTVLESENESANALTELQSDIFSILNKKIARMAGLDKITLDMLPDNIRSSLISKDGSSYLISINPTQNPWEGGFRNIFTSQVNSVTDKGTGMILAADQLTIMAEEDGRRASVLALLVVFIILVADFRNIKLAVITMLPLLASFITLFGIMAVTGIKFDFVNIIVVPLLIGIGIDDAVHINHRYLHEGKGSMSRVIARTGTALLITTVTTVIGFASFIPSLMRAMKSTGIVLSLAMAIAFIYSVFLHPAVLIIVTEKLGWNIKPWRTK